jgi:hypothetical protein
MSAVRGTPIDEDDLIMPTKIRAWREGRELLFQYSDSPIVDRFIRQWLDFREGNPGLDFGPIGDVVDAFCNVVETDLSDQRQGWLDLACELVLYRDAVARLCLAEIVHRKCDEFIDLALQIAALYYEQTKEKA